MALHPNDRDYFALDTADPELPQHLYETLDELAQCPVAWSPASGGFWALSRYDDVVQVSQDWQTFTVTNGIMIPPTGASMRVVPLELDPPRHTLFRKLLMPDFSPRAIEVHIPAVRKIIESAFEPVLSRGHAELVGDIFSPVPVLAVCQVLGITGDWQTIRDLGSAFLSAGADREAAHAAASALEEFLQVEIEARKGYPVVDLLGAYVTATLDGDAMSPQETLGLVQLLVLAGHETTVVTMASAAYRLMREPEACARLRADRTLIDQFINETLRLHPPAWHFARTVTQAAEFGDRTLCPGERVTMVYGNANRDPAKFEDPDRFDLDRKNSSQHLSFGVGRHRCVGESFARMELRLTLDYLLDHMPDLELVGEPEWGGGTNTHGIKRLDVTFTAQPSGAH